MANKVICSIKDCDNFVRCKNLCTKHYNQTKKYHLKNDRKPRRRFLKYKATCRRKQIPFTLTFEEWEEIIRVNKCYYCLNILPTTGIGLDRKYPSVGYFKDNVVPCCHDCNKTKGDRFSFIEFEIMMKALTKFRETNGRKKLQK